MDRRNNVGCMRLASSVQMLCDEDGVWSFYIDAVPVDIGRVLSDGICVEPWWDTYSYELFVESCPAFVDLGIRSA